MNNTSTKNPKQLQDIQNRLQHAYEEVGLWGVINPASPLPNGISRGSDTHLAFLTLVYAISGGRDPVPLWDAARQTFAQDVELFHPAFLAYAKPITLIDRLHQRGLTHKAKSEATTWQRIGQALMMRAGGSVKKLLHEHDFDAKKMMAMLSQSKATFPVLSGAQTAPRWLYGLTAVGKQPLKNAYDLPVPLSPNGKKALASFNIQATKISAQAFAAVDALGRYGCQQMRPSHETCPAAIECPIATYCQYGSELTK